LQTATDDLHHVYVEQSNNDVLIKTVVVTVLYWSSTIPCLSCYNIACYCI